MSEVLLQFSFVSLTPGLSFLMCYSLHPLAIRGRNIFTYDVTIYMIINCPWVWINRGERLGKQESDNTHIAANKICCSISDCLYCLMTDEKFALFCAVEF